jgi:hypothetical protein
MSTITVDNIRIASESVSRPVAGVAAAYINYNSQQTSGSPSTSGIRGSFNVSSITEIQIGTTTISYANNFTDSSYTTTLGTNTTHINFTGSTYGPSSVNIITQGNDNNNNAASYVTAIAVGELA